MNHAEDREQAAYFAIIDALADELLDLRLRSIFHVPNGGARSAVTGAMLKRQGVRAGVPDIICPAMGKTGGPLAIEMKAGKNKPTHEQIRWHWALTGMGWRVETCYSAGAALMATMDHLQLPYDEQVLRNRVIMAGGSWGD